MLNEMVILLNENKDNRLKAIMIKSSQNNDNDHSSDRFIGTKTVKQTALNNEMNKATTAKPVNLPK